MTAARPATTAPAACAEIDRKLDTLTTRSAALESRIDSNRTSNQTLGYLGAFFIVPLVGVETNSAEKDTLDADQRERDRLISERAAGGCPGRPSDPAGRMIPAAP